MLGRCSQMAELDSRWGYFENRIDLGGELQLHLGLGGIISGQGDRACALCRAACPFESRAGSCHSLREQSVSRTWRRWHRHSRPSLRRATRGLRAGVAEGKIVPDLLASKSPAEIEEWVHRSGWWRVCQWSSPAVEGSARADWAVALRWSRRPLPERAGKPHPLIWRKSGRLPGTTIPMPRWQRLLKDTGTSGFRFSIANGRFVSVDSIIILASSATYRVPR